MLPSTSAAPSSPATASSQQPDKQPDSVKWDLIDGFHQCYEDHYVLHDGDGNVEFQHLQRIETRRRKILQRVEMPLHRVLFSWDGTCLRALVLDWMIWATVGIFIIVRVRARQFDNAQDEPDVVYKLTDTDVDILGGFLSFLLVLFVNQTNSRFMEMYGMAKACAGRVQDVAGLVVSHPNYPPVAAARLVRYMNVAHIVGYVGLSGSPYHKRNFFNHFQQQHNLLEPRELARVENLAMDVTGSMALKELVTWCQRQVGVVQKAGHIDNYEAQQLQSRILAFRASMDGIYDYCDQPPHFFYIHFLCLLSALYLPLFAFDNASAAGWGEDADWSVELLNGTIVLLQAIFVVGLRLLGQKMLDPFGDDLEDLSVITYITTTLDNCRIILTASYPTPDDTAGDKTFGTTTSSLTDHGPPSSTNTK